MESSDENEEERQSCGDRSEGNVELHIDHEAKESSTFALDEQRVSEDLRLPKIFVPSASDILLMHAVLTHDEELLGDLLSDMSPNEVLSVRDPIGRSMYHYAALSKRQRTRSVVFGHACTYYDRDLQWQIDEVTDTTQHLHVYVCGRWQARSAWLFRLGAGVVLTVDDIEELLHLNSSKSIRDQLLREVELLDTVNIRLQSTDGTSDSSGDEGGSEDDRAIEPGLSVFLAAKLERDVASLAEARDANGWTALHVVLLLLKAGDKWGVTPLMLAATIRDVR
ncbi:hypothetical protein PybrP1_005339 [[Pythium] brassicae (nom. inval.)]|nr:hypothetical protein PybrP1_005339 [[Pythium] brassicae (nom. inval.)]